MKSFEASDPYINHFAQADTVVPGAGSSQAWDRYAYAMNNPLRYVDPSGHESCDPDDEKCQEKDNNECASGLNCAIQKDDPIVAPSTETLPSPACEAIDCVLSAISLIASAFTYTPYATEAFVVDLVVTAISIVRTNDDFDQGEISQTRQWVLNGTAFVGVFPSNPFGVGSSLANTIFTFTGIPK